MEIHSWGANSHGQLGQGHFKDTYIPGKVDVTEMYCSQFQMVSGGGGHTAFISGERKLYLCGLNDQSQLGDHLSDLKSNPIPRFLSKLTVQKVACGWDFTLAISDLGQLWSWGSNSFGQTGQDILCKKILQPTIVEEMKEVPFSDVSAGLRHAAAVATCGDVWTWGDTKKGQIPASHRGSALERASRPVKISSPKEVKQVHCGAFFTLLLTNDGQLFGLGDNSRGQLTCDPSKEIKISSVIQLDVPKCLAVAVGWSHVISISNQGEVYSWGRCDYGQLGRSCAASGCDYSPGLVLLPTAAFQVCCGSEHSLALTKDGCLFAWGWNEHGMCAMSESVPSIPLPRSVSFGANARVVSVGAGAGHSFAFLQYSKF